MFAVRTVRAVGQNSLAANIKRGITGQSTVLTISPSFHPATEKRCAWQAHPLTGNDVGIELFAHWASAGSTRKVNI